MGQRIDFIATAKGELGVIEGPKENETKYGAFTKANFQPWCGSFVNWVANEVKLKIPNCVYTPGGASAFMKKGQWEDASDVAQPLPGDIAFFDFPGDNVNRISHIGIVVKDNGTELLPVSKAILPQIRRVISATEGKYASRCVRSRRRMALK